MKKRRVLFVDDEKNVINSLIRLFRDEPFEISAAFSGQEALTLVEKQPYALILSDYRMPGMSGLDFLEKAKKISPGTVLIILTGYADTNIAISAINGGAIYKFIQKPWDNDDLKIQIRQAIEYYDLIAEREELLSTVKGQNDELTEWNSALEERVGQKTKELKSAYGALQESYLDTIQCLVMAAEYKNEDTGTHIIRISKYSTLIAKKLGRPNEEIENIFYASPMHDVGKIGVPDSILTKSGKLSDEEFALIKQHTIIGANILSNTKSGILECAQRIARTHHEKWNGSGYPDGLSKEDIPLEGRIVCIADVFDALSSKRPYKDAYPPEIVKEIIRRGRGIEFDPAITDIFLEQYDAMVAIREEMGCDEDENGSEFRFSDRDNTLRALIESHKN